MSVIEASSTACKTMADGTLRITVDVEPRHAQAAFTLVGSPGVPMALARLQAPAPEPAPEPEPERLKGGMAAKWLAMRCADPDFQAWLYSAYRTAWAMNASSKQTTEQHAASVIRAVCSVESRAEIDNDPAANERFQRLIRGPWQKFTVSRS